MELLNLYCERTGPGVLVEGWNLLACLGLLLSAILIFRMSAGLIVLQAMASMTLVLFLTSVAVHIHPNSLTVGAALASVLAVILVFFFGINRDVLGLSGRISLVCSALVLPLAALSLPLVALLPGANSSAAYIAFPVLMLGYAVAVRPQAPKAAQGLLVGALLLIANLVVRSLDKPLCATFPMGTHFLWILGSALLLWHLALVYRRHMLAARAGGR